MTDNSEPKPFSQPPVFSTGPGPSRIKLFALIGFFILLVGAFMAVIILPGRYGSERENSQATPETGPALNGEEINEDAALKEREARELLQKILKLQARLENEGVKVWGEELLDTSYSQALSTLAEADAYLGDRLFDQALERYQGTISKLEQLAASRPERIRRAIMAGDKAYEKRDSKLAVHHYEIALSADPANSGAQAGLQRSRNLPQVLEYIEHGVLNEGNGNLDLARKLYNDALSLDKEFQPARDHLRNVDALILDRDYKEAMSAAILALNQEEIEQARQSLDIAKKLHPDTTGVRDLEQQLKNVELRIEFERLGKRAIEYEQSEDWKMALKEYDSVLKIDPNAGFAQKGKLRAEGFIELDRKVQSYLSNPGDLQAPEHMEHARRIYETAAAKSDIGPKFRKNTEKLYRLLEMYNIPVSIMMRSDGLTDVRIYRVGRLGRFIVHRLELRPGRYKVLGVRSGYRDFSTWLPVPVASEEITISVTCKEKI